jgi:preprotein translocase subunit SecG
VFFYILLFVLILNGFFLAVVVLLQSGKGGGLASMGGGAGTDTLIGGRQAATLLTKATWTSGGIFLTLALVLSLMSARSTAPRSILQGDFRNQGTTQTPTSILPGTQPAAPTTGTAPQTPPPATTNQ